MHAQRHTYSQMNGCACVYSLLRSAIWALENNIPWWYVSSKLPLSCFLIYILNPIFYFFFTPFHISALGHMKAFNIDCNVEGVQRAHRLILQLLIYLERERWCSASPLKHNTIASFFNPAWVIQSADGNMKYCRNCERWILHWSLGDEVFFSKHHGQCGVWMCVGVSVCVRERSWCASRLIWTMFIHRIRLFGWNVGRLHETTWQTLLKGMQY